MPDLLANAPKPAVPLRPWDKVLTLIILGVLIICTVVVIGVILPELRYLSGEGTAMTFLRFGPLTLVTLVASVLTIRRLRQRGRFCFVTPLRWFGIAIVVFVTSNVMWASIIVRGLHS